MADEPDNLVLELLRGIRAEIDAMRAQMATKSELAEVKADPRSDIRSLRADVASDLLVMQAKTDTEFRAVRDQIVRLRRVEQHLNLSASDAH